MFGAILVFVSCPWLWHIENRLYRLNQMSREVEKLGGV
jgi:hypothetical protein